MAGVFGFSSDDAKRIGDAVRKSERERGQRSISGAEFGGAVPGVRLMLAKRSTAAWLANTSAIVTAYAGNHVPTNNVGTMVAWNYFADLPTVSTAATWVGLGHNGFGWIVVAARC
jgi:hypothetical protein